MLWWVVTALMFAADVAAADFGTKGGPEPANIDEIANVLRQDPYDMELLISYGTSKGGSAGHIALAIRDQVPGDDLVYTANFYADRAPKHAKGFYTDDLMVRIPKKEYLFQTNSSLGDTASFGLDFGEIYKRSVIGVRVYGVPAAEKEALAAFFQRINDDYHNRARNTEYHQGEIRYDYLRLNCAKTIGAGFKYGAGYQDLEVTSAKLLSGRRVVAAANANIPTEMAMKLLARWNERGYRLDVVWYKKYEGSTYVDPHEDGQGGVQGPAEPVSLGPVQRLQERAGSLRGHRQSLRDVPPLQSKQVPRARERRDEAARDRQEQGAYALSGGCRSRHPECPVRQRKFPSACTVPAAGNGDRAVRERHASLRLQR